MATIKPMVLIVEDEPDFNRLFTFASVAALADFQKVLPTLYQKALSARSVSIAPVSVRGEVLQAFDQAQAQRVIAEHATIAFVSVYLALGKGEAGHSDHDRAEGKEASGIRVLQELSRLGRSPLAVIATGETLLAYAREAFQKYKVLAFFQKARLDLRDYQQTVLAALWYHEAARHLEQIESYAEAPEYLAVAQACWEQALAYQHNPAGGQQRSLDLSFPEDLGLRIKLMQSRLDPVTGCPNSDWTKAALKQRVIGGDDWSLFQTRVPNLSMFRAAYPSQLDALQALIFQSLKRALNELHEPESFIGLIGREYRAEPCFIAIIRGRPTKELQRIAQKVGATFQADTLSLLPYTDRQRTDLIPKLALVYWTSDVTDHQHDFADLHAAIDLLSTDQ